MRNQQQQGNWKINKYVNLKNTFLNINGSKKSQGNLQTLRESTMYQKLQDIAKAVLKGQSVAINVYIEKKKVLNQQPNFTH